MAQKKFSQFFAKDFVGIDGESTPLEEDSFGVNRAVNLEYGIGNSLRGRLGCQIAAQTGQFYAIFTYTYTRTQDQYDIVYQVPSGAHPTQVSTLSTTKTSADGATITKLIGINEQMWILDTMTIPVTRVSGSYPFTWYTFVSGSNINFQIKANGASILNTSLGDGISSSTSIYSLLGTIDALAELSVSRTTRGTCPPVAIVDGNQSSVAGASATYGTQYTVTVDAGHTFYPGDIITFPTSPLRGGFVTAITATTITYVGQQVTLTDNQVLGYMGQMATAFPISTASSASSGTLNMAFPYWRLLPEGDRQFGTIYLGNYNAWANRTAGGFYAPATSTNASGNLYVAASARYSNGVANWPNNLVKIDGVTGVRAGLPQATLGVAAGGAGALTGTFKYKAFFRRVDAQGNITEGVPSTVQSVTLAAQVATVTPTFTNIDYAAGSGFGGRSCYKDTNEAPASGEFFLVDNSAAAVAFIQPGDPICLMDNTAPKAGLTGVGTLHRTVCTGYDGATAASAIRVADSSAYTITNNTPISTGLTVVFTRTTAGGNQHYVLCEMPVTGYTNFSFTDNVTDAVLSAGEQYVEIEIGKEHNPPPPCTLVCQHQGGLVVARGPFSPNTVAFSTADGIEHFPTASNSFEVPSTQSGGITAIASDTNDRLAVFKERAYYDVTGDLDTGLFSVQVKNEGDYGITSQASLARVGDSLVGLSRNGFVSLSDGLLSWIPFKGVNTRVINQNYSFAWAVGVNDSFSRQYICSIPVPSSEPVTLVLDYSKERLIPLERSYTTQIDPAGGMAVVGDSLYHLSLTSPYGLFKRLPRFASNSPSGNGDGDSFIDNTNAISYILESNPISNNEPEILNTPIRLRVWSLPNDYVQEGWVPFSLLVETGASALATYVGGSNNGATSSSVTFSASSDVFKDIKLVSPKTHFFIVRLTTNTIRTAPFITGYTILYAESYKPEDLIK